MVNKLTTEEKILQAAEQEFIEKGLAGARMQQIADTAGINKALLHYYYRSKDKLFEIVFKTAIQNFLIPKLIKILNSNNNLEDKIKQFVYQYITVIQGNMHIPNFILYELSINPMRIQNVFKEVNIDIEKFKEQLKQEISNKNIIEISAEELIINIISMCVFPFVAKPIITAVFYNNIEDYEKLIENRKTSVSNFIINAIKLK
jgi:AcrR family transcriptional regulator